jgi:hypothetical protein
MHEETALEFPAWGIAYPVVLEAQASVQMCKLRNRVHTARGAVGALQVVHHTYVVLGSCR